MDKNTPIAPKVSILMPVYNAAAYLPDCLASIRKQDFTHWELLAVDDHSQDASLEILRGAAAQDGRIRLFQNKEKGIIPALRLAYAQSRGDYVSRMDADDKMVECKLRLLLEALGKAGPGHLAVGAVRYFSEGRLGEGYRRYADWLNGLIARGSHFDEIYKECVIPSPCWMLGREDLEACGAFRPDDYPEDYDLCFRFYAAGLKVVGVPEVLHLWRDHPARSSRNDPHYADNRFLEMKSRYFKQLDYRPGEELFLWGAGPKGKQAAKELQRQNIPFRWVCDNPKKLGRDIYGVRMEHYEAIGDGRPSQLLLAVSAPSAQPSIRAWLAQRENCRYWWLC